jgi:hypothetical protein
MGRERRGSSYGSVTFASLAGWETGKKKSKKEMGEEMKGKRAGEGTGRHGGLDYAEGFLEALVVV